jgi:ribosomal protein L34E
MKQKHYCNNCERLVEEINELEQEELNKEGSFLCSNCINKEMEIEQILMEIL